MKINASINFSKIKSSKKHYPSPGVIVERRNHKVKTDYNKLFGTKPNHKYYE